MIGLLGKKVGMTRIFNDMGVVIPVTVIKVDPCTIIQIKTMQRDKYKALQLGFQVQAESRVNLPLKKHYEKANAKPCKYLQEFRLAADADLKGFELGGKIDVSIFSIGEKVKVSGTSKGRGFQGVVKRHGFSGGDASHGCRSKRVPGSIGQCQTPGRVFKGKKMPGQYGNKRITIKNLEIVAIDAKENLLLIKGAVPGPNKGLLRIEKEV